MVEEADTIRACHRLARRGFLFGGSTGTVVSGAMGWLAQHDGRRPHRGGHRPGPRRALPRHHLPDQLGAGPVRRGRAQLCRSGTAVLPDDLQQPRRGRRQRSCHDAPAMSRDRGQLAQGASVVKKSIEIPMAGTARRPDLTIGCEGTVRPASRAGALADDAGRRRCTWSTCRSTATSSTTSAPTHGHGPVLRPGPQARRPARRCRCKDIYQHPTIADLATALGDVRRPLRGSKRPLRRRCWPTSWHVGTRVPRRQQLLRHLGADSMVMAQFCARVRKRADLPAVSMKDIYQHPTIADLATAIGDVAPIHGRSGPGRRAG